MSRPTPSPHADWPALPYPEWSATCRSLHLRTQIVGKVRLALSPWVNHSWHVPLYVTARGLGTSPVPNGNRMFELDFDLFDHQLVITPFDGPRRTVPLVAESIASFHCKVFATLVDLGIPVRIHRVPSEIPDAIPFDEDTEPRPWNREAVSRFWRALVQVDRVLKQFRSSFLGKVSPVHFFWGSFDLAVTRFSGRTAPPHPGGVPNFPDWVAREAYSHEVSSAGFWPGGPGFETAAFYSYAYPEPEGFADASVMPEAASYSSELGEFVLPYEEVRGSASPDATLLDFLTSTYAAAADLARWDRNSLEPGPGWPRVP